MLMILKAKFGEVRKKNKHLYVKKYVYMCYCKNIFFKFKI